MPENITGDPATPGGAEHGFHSSSIQKPPAPQQPSQMGVLASIEGNEQHGPDQSARRAIDDPTEHAQSQEQDQRLALQDDPSEETHSNGPVSGDDDSMSDGSSDSGMFVQQDAEIKSEVGSHTGRHSLCRTESERSANGAGNHDDDESQDEDEDEDDECIIVDAKDVPEAIKTKFDGFKFGIFPQGSADILCTGSVHVKKEPDDDSIIFVSDPETDDEFRVDEGDILSDGERPRERHRRAPKRQRKQQAADGDMEPIDVVLPTTEVWQQPTQDELFDLFTKQEELNALKVQGSLSLAQMVTLAKITARIAAVEKASQQPSGSMDQFLDDEDDDDEVEEELNRALAAATGGLPQSSAQGGTKTPAPVEVAEGAHQQEKSANRKQRKPTRPAPRTAKEYWERQYAEKGSGLPDITENPRKRKRPLKKAGKKDASRENKLMCMLKDSNPIMARAAQGAMAMPGPIQATRRDDQLKAMKDFLFKISSNPNPRDWKADMKILQRAIKSFGSRKVRADDGRWKLKGMKSTLYNHQLVGVSWMLGQEFSPDGPYGGILGDQMGLGKTVQVLAAMSVNRPSPEDVQAGRNQTLIIAPAIAISQWKREIERHCCEKTFIKRVHHYKSKQNLDAWMWKSADIILASYNEVAKAYPSEKTLRRIAGRKLDNEEWAEEFEAELGELFGHQFFRVVLDEGHTIRNNHTKTAKACINLTSKYRWILTGTPLHNSIEEFFPYFRFLGAHWAEDQDQFSKQFGNLEKDDPRARIAAVITSIMLRRRVDDHFLGAPILQIPQTHPTKIVWVDLTVEERLIYRRLESRFRDNMSTHLKAGIAQKKMKTYLAYLTRLRQGVAHQFLLEDVLKQNFTLEDFNYLRRQLTLVGGKTPMHRQLQHWVELEYEASTDGDGNLGTFGKSRFGYEFDMDAELEQIEAGKSIEDVICRICYETPDDPTITECGHTFCRDCIAGVVVVKPSCPTCNAMLFQVDALRQPEGAAGEQSDDEDRGRRRRRRKNKKEKREVGDDENRAQPKLRDSSKWIKQYDRSYPHKHLMASAKTMAVKNQILIWQREAPDDKIIVFVNWAKLACIIGRMLFEEEIPFLYYFGDLSPEEKAAAIPDFQENASIKVMIASIRCGGQALNLTCANRVILVDQWWNTAMETQAFGRVHRIGQEKETHFVKIVVKDSIDEWLLEMGQAKEGMISKALQEDAAHKTAPTLEELVRLFRVDDSAATEGDDEAVAEGGVIELSEDEDGEGDEIGSETTEAEDAGDETTEVEDGEDEDEV